VLLVQSLSNFREIYQFLRYNKKFYIINSPTQICLINTLNDEVKVLDIRGNDIADNLSLQVRYNLAKLPPHIYLAKYIRGSTDTNLSIPTRESDAQFHIFDVKLEDKTYEQRITFLQLHSQEIENRHITVQKPTDITIAPTLNNLQIWQLLNNYGSKYLLKAHASYFYDRNIIKPRVILDTAIVVNKGNMSIDVKYNNKIYTVISGLTKEDYYNINIKDTVICAFTETYAIYVMSKNN